MNKPSDPFTVSAKKKSARRRRSVSGLPGRPTPDAESLRTHRDSLAWLLSENWPDIGWKLPQAKNLETLRAALHPLKGHPSDHLVRPFLHPTPIDSTPSEIRLLRDDFGDAVEKSREAQTKHDACTGVSARAEQAMNQSSPEMQGSFFPELLKGWKERRESHDKLEIARKNLAVVEKQLAAKEAGFSQNELLDFISSRLYARDPLGIANAVAGFPMMTWQTSRTRCSEITCAQWPIFHYRVFLKIEEIWNRRDAHPQPPLVQLFQQEIARLPKTHLVFNPDTGKKHKQQESLRKHLADNFYHLRSAVEEVSQQSSIHPQEMPFRIASVFTKNMGKPRTVKDQILIDREQIK
jgi:hypothetical protein